MKSTIQLDQKNYEFNLEEFHDISTTYGSDDIQAWYLDPLTISPVRSEAFTGSVAEGGSVNFRNISFNPHGHGTHTECYGHISKEQDVFLKDCLKSFYFPVWVLSPDLEEEINEDGKKDLIVKSINLPQINGVKGLVIRTQSAGLEMKNYSDTNPCYLDANIIPSMIAFGIEHIMIDQPSVDREEDGGALAAHHAFFGYPDNIRSHHSISEICNITPDVKDGLYMAHISIFNIANDASPSKITLHPLTEI